MKILLLSRYTSLGASSRLRSYQYLPFLREAGWIVDDAPLFGDQYLNALYGGRNQTFFALQGYLERISRLFQVRKYDLLWIEKELLPFFPAGIEILLGRVDIPYLVDYDDAIFHRYSEHPNRMIRSLLGKKISRVMRSARVVTVGNDYLAEYARKSGAENITIIPTAVDLARYPNLPKEDHQNVTVGWIGTPSTSHYLFQIEETIREISKLDNVRLTAVGARQKDLDDLPVQAIPWSEDTEVASLQEMDIGIMPLANGPWEKGKCGYKLIQYMACGLPVVASNVGANPTIISDGVEGYLADDSGSWCEALSKLVHDQELRETMGRQGREKVEKVYSTQIQGPRLKQAIRKAVE